jgi:predicted enzyme related to lactoylglutathione lyase
MVSSSGASASRSFSLSRLPKKDEDRKSKMTEPLLFTTRRIIVYVENLDQAIPYYRDVLGFKPLGGVEGVNCEFATSGPPVVLHAGGKSQGTPGGLSGFVPSFSVASGLDKLMGIYKDRQVSIVGDVEEVSHGWIAFIADMEGNVIQIYQPKR